MKHPFRLVLVAPLLFLGACDSVYQEKPKTSDAPMKQVDVSGAGNGAVAAGWKAGDTIPSGMDGVPDIQILEVHANGSGDACGEGKRAKLKYKAMLANGKVLDPGTRPFEFRVGAGEAIRGWDVIVPNMKIGDSFTVLVPKQLAYGEGKGDLKFNMELLSVR